jgi:hypothetical protein
MAVDQHDQEGTVVKFVPPTLAIGEVCVTAGTRLMFMTFLEICD